MLHMLRNATKCTNTDEICTFLSDPSEGSAETAVRIQVEAVVVSAGAEGSINASGRAFSWRILTGSRACLSVTVSGSSGGEPAPELTSASSWNKRPVIIC